MEGAFSYKPVRFFGAAIRFTWAAWFAAAYVSGRPGAEAQAWLSVLELAGLFGPPAAALWMIFGSGSAELRGNFYTRLFDLRAIRLSTLAFIFILMPALIVLSVFLSWVFFGHSLEQLRPATAVIRGTSGFVPLPVMFFGAALAEELGWKGYGADSLRGERTFFTATWIYAGLWALWHVPLFFIDHYYHNLLWRTNPLFVLNFFASIVPAAFLINWLWYRNEGNILTAVLFHGVINCQALIGMRQTAKGIETLLLFAAAAVVVALYRKIFFAEFPRTIGSFGRDERGVFA